MTLPSSISQQEVKNDRHPVYYEISCNKNV